MRGRGGVVEARSQIFTDGVLAAELDDRLARVVNGAQEYRLQVRTPGGVLTGSVGAVLGGFGHAVHRPQ